ncbi:MAG: PLDc N-terminal domain-containing protein [Candidatus Aenigmatarchaeota archaeon]
MYFAGIVEKLGSFVFIFLVALTTMVIALWIISIIDCLKSKKKSKWFWFLALILLLFIGSLLYFVIEKKVYKRKREN